MGEMRNNLSLTSNLRVILPSYIVTSNETTRKVVFFCFFFFEGMLIIEKMCREK